MEAGALQLTVAELAPAVAETLVGAPGTVDGVALAEGDEAAPAPALFVAVTVKVYEVPFVRDPTLQDVVAVVHVRDPGVEVTE